MAQIQKGSTYLARSHRHCASLWCHGDHQSKGREAQLVEKPPLGGMVVGAGSQGTREHQRVGEMTVTARCLSLLRE
jgi:hypothetical protein